MSDIGIARRLRTLSKSPCSGRHDDVGRERAADLLKENPMKYMLLIYGNEAAAQAAHKSDTEKMLAAYGAYTEAMQKAGIMLSGERLRPSSAASTVRVVEGKSEVLDGPYADTKEQLGGFYLIDVPDLDAALGWAARCPGASRGRIEVRPLWVS